MMFIRAVLTILGLVSCAAVSLAQVAKAPTQSDPFANPLAPSPRDPQGILRTAPGSRVFLHWRQQEFAPAGTNAPARNFLLCLYVPGTSDCTSTPLRWMLAATTIQRVPVTQPSTVIQPFVTAYDYTFRVSVTPEVTDVQAEWGVGACSSEVESSCTFVTTPVWFTTRDLRANYINYGVSGMKTLSVAGVVDNEGMTDSGPFETHLLVFEALADRSGCIVDVNAEGVEPWHAAITRGGDVIEIRDLPRDANGRPDASRQYVVAITPYPSLPIAQTNTTDGQLAVDASATVVELEVDLSGYRLPATFAPVMLVDLNNDLTEYNESNNGRGGCMTISGE